MDDDHPGGRSDHHTDDASAGLRIATLAWRVRLCALTFTGAYLMAGASTALLFLASLRLCALTFTGAYLMAGASTALLFLASLGVAAIVFAAGSALARFEHRVRVLRTERRK